MLKTKFLNRISGEHRNWLNSKKLKTVQFCSFFTLASNKEKFTPKGL